MTLGCKKTCRSQGMAVKGHFISFRARPGRFFAARIDNSGENVVSYFYPECHTGVPMQIQTKKFAGLTGNQLKLLALFAMTCDHVGLQLLPQFIILRIIGRLAAPLFAYMIAEGCRYTHDRGRYLGRLLGMAALCQIAYFAAMRSLYQCIFVTFSLSVCLIYALDNAVRRRTPVSVLSAAGAVRRRCRSAGSALRRGAVVGASERSPSGAVQRKKRHMEYRPAVLLVLPRPSGRDLRPEPASDTRRRITYRPGRHPRYIRRK